MPSQIIHGGNDFSQPRTVPLKPLTGREELGVVQRETIEEKKYLKVTEEGGNSRFGGLEDKTPDGLPVFIVNCNVVVETEFFLCLNNRRGLLKSKET